MKRIKNYWNNFVGKILVKLSNLFDKLHRNWELHKKRENFKKTTKRMVEIVDYMEKRSVSKLLKENENARVAVNEADKNFSSRFNEVRTKIINMESTTRDNVDDPVVDRLLEKFKELPLQNTDPVEDLSNANQHMMTDDKFVELLKNLKSQNVIEERKAITINQ